MPQVYLVGGKGGVGKTSVSLALAHMFAAHGERTLWMEVAELPRLGHFFPGARNRFEPAEVAPNLFALNHVHAEALEEYLEIVFRVRWLTRRISENSVFGAVTQALPGIESLVLLGKILYEAERTRRGALYWNKIILDSPATGHGKQLLQFPKAAREIVQFGPVAETARKIDKWVRDPGRWSNLLVTLPEALPVQESLEMQTWMADALGYPVSAVLLNQVIDVTEGGPNVPAAGQTRVEWIRQWQTIQRQYGQRLSEESAAPILNIPVLGPHVDERQRLELISRFLSDTLLNGRKA